ncbi:hypothetical protein LOTGIDRAFT_238341 [Lottia gigantea]|uniref:LEM domain-containing protein n=1 Tax=Lottia gigantea TaxID=225164 RepID=V4CGD2_LOTGI|nr:hypothetical protein LOTGIDRAFT_238341 [Lottia gigantea]ESP01135.1 hypothetical protein LOTGIDRAFT_238341 [Lottia gigantea]
MPPIPDLELMSNRELVELLKEYGISSGPIVGSTRKIYEKKLLQKLTGEEIKSQYAPAPHDDSEEDVPPSPAYKDLSDSRSQPRKRGFRSGTPENVEPLNESYRRSPRLNKKPMKFTSTPIQKPGNTDQDSSKNSSSSGGIPLWIKIVLILIAIVIGYLVLQNMEISVDNNIPRGIEAEV